MTQLPDYLKPLTNAPSLAARAAEGIGSSLPPHISIGGNQFALIDVTGAEIPVDTKWLDVCVVDRSDVTCKMFFGKDWEPGATDMPLCFSMNGIAPSVDAAEPQARTCAECPKNVRGSATSKMSGKAVKACRDEIKLAFVIPPFMSEGKPVDLAMLLQFTLTPGSFTNWRAYVEKFKGQQFDLRHVVTRLTFERDKSGVVEFNVRPYVQGGPAPWIDQATAVLVQKALESKATDLLVGRLDRPRGGELPAPAPQQQIAAPAQLVPSSNVVGETAPAGRRRRTKAEMEAARATEAPQAQPLASGFAPAPFRPADPPPAGTPQAPFGIASAPPPDPGMQQTLNDIFGPA